MIKSSGIFNFFKNPFLQLLIGAVCISFSPILVKLANTDPDIVGFYRNFFGLFLFLFVIIYYRISIFKGWISLVLPVIAGVVFFLDMYAWHKSIYFVGPGIATLLGNFQVFFMVLFGIIFLKEKLTIRFFVSLPVALFGIFLLVGGTRIDFSNSYGKGILLGFLTAFFYSIFLIVLRISQARKDNLSHFTNLFYISISASLSFFLWGVFNHKSYMITDTKTIGVLLAYAFIAHFVGWIFITRSLSKVKASIAGLLLLLQPVLAIVWEAIFFKKDIDLVQFSGISFAVIAIYFGSNKNRVKPDEN